MTVYVVMGHHADTVILLGVFEEKEDADSCASEWESQRTKQFPDGLILAGVKETELVGKK